MRQRSRCSQCRCGDGSSGLVVCAMLCYVAKLAQHKTVLSHYCNIAAEHAQCAHVWIVPLRTHKPGTEIDRRRHFRFLKKRFHFPQPAERKASATVNGKLQCVSAQPACGNKKLGGNSVLSLFTVQFQLPGTRNQEQNQRPVVPAWSWATLPHSICS